MLSYGDNDDQAEARLHNWVHGVETPRTKRKPVEGFSPV